MACQRLWREQGFNMEGQESGILLPTATGPESPQASPGPSQHSAEKRKCPWTVPPAQPVPGETSSSQDLELGPKALTPLLSTKPRLKGFVKSNKDSKQGFSFFFSSTWGKRNKESDAAAPLGRWVTAANFPGAVYLPGQWTWAGRSHVPARQARKIGGGAGHSPWPNHHSGCWGPGTWPRRVHGTLAGAQGQGQAEGHQVSEQLGGTCSQPRPRSHTASGLPAGGRRAWGPWDAAWPLQEWSRQRTVIPFSCGASG